MKALLLAAGLGTRLKPVTDNIPKCLVPLNDHPLLSYWLSLLTKGGCHPLLVNTHHFADKVEEYVKASEYRSYVQTVYEKDLLGTAGTVLKNRDFFGAEAFMLVHADNLSLFDVHAFIEQHQARPAGCEMTMMTYITPTPETCGIVELDKGGVVKSFYEKVSFPREIWRTGLFISLNQALLISWQV